MSQGADDELPEHLKWRPAKLRDWPFPTAWLLGTKLLGSLRDIVLSSVVKVDLRTWMTPGDVVDRTKATVSDNDEECCYIDFLADTGDSQRLVYQLARLLKQEQLVVKAWRDGAPTETTLPRGSLLVFGGDIAYPVATHRRLLERIRAPFKWAHDELEPAEKQRLEANPVTLLAVPGNHDYYDGLRGFEAMFHAPPVHPYGPVTPGKPRRCAAPSGGKAPSEQPLRLPGYKLEQHASYFAAALPFGWQLWGLDIENHAIDDRQAAYFEWAKKWKPGVGQQVDAGEGQSLARAPEKLIVVTSRPAFVYQGPSDHADVIRRSMASLGLAPAFDQNGVLDSTNVRLDLSGDVHLYERYWGTDDAEMPDDLDRVEALRKEKRHPAEMDAYEPPERYAPAEDNKKQPRRGNDREDRGAAPGCTNYASVVSGLGGTFHHPSQLRMGKTPARATWPSAEHSAREIGIRLADPWQMFRAGAVGVVGFAVALACYWLVSTSGMSFNVLDLPFALSSSLSDDQTDALRHLGRVAAIVVTVVAMVGLPIGAYYVGRCWSTPIREMREPWTWWTRLTRFLTHNRPTQRVLRLLGANARSSWMFLTNIVPIGATLGGWWWLHSRLDDLAEAVAVERGRKIAVYAIITILVLAMAALGCFVAGKKQPRERLWLNIGRRGVFLLFGVIVALLVIWTPYAWACLVCRNHFFIPVVIALFPLTMLFQLGRTFFPRSLSVRRVTTALGFCGLAAIAVVVPLCFVDMDGSSVTSSYSPTWSVMAAFLGAYFASLWVGWYFCICLQWNAHGNEAGSAARITDYGEFLRIKLTPYEAEVWAIAVEEALDPKPSLYYRLSGRKATTVDRKPPTARLIDHFRVNVPTRRGPPQGPDRPPPNTELPTVPATPASAQLPMPIGPEKPPIE